MGRPRRRGSRKADLTYLIPASVAADGASADGGAREELAKYNSTATRVYGPYVSTR